MTSSSEPVIFGVDPELLGKAEAPKKLSPLRWQFCCGKKLGDVLGTLRHDYLAEVLAIRRAALAPGRSEVIPRPKVTTLFKVEHHEVSPRNAQLCADSN